MSDTTALTKEEGLARLWNGRLVKEKKAHEKFRKQAKSAAKLSLDEEGSGSFNIMWANNKIIRSAIYGKRPVPDVRRRYTQRPNPDEKNLALMIERGLEFQLDTDSFESSSRAVVKDFVETSLGIPRVIYDVETRPMELGPEALMAMQAAGVDEIPEEVVSQSVGIEHIPWKHFHWEPGNNEWNNVGWVAFEYYASQKEVREQYGVHVATGQESKDKRAASKYQDEVHLFEIWDKRTRRVITLADGHPEPVEIRDDELQLQGFFPCPRPAFDNLKSDELIPKPDSELIIKRVNELNRLTQRRAGLVEKVKPIRLFDASMKEEMQTALNAKDGANVPVVGASAKFSSGLQGSVFDVPLGDIVGVIRELDAQIESVKAQIYEVTGISDIVRGSSMASETATAQQIKGQWANVRLMDKTAEVNRIFRDCLRMMGEIMCEHFDPMQLSLMTGIEITPQMQQMMRTDVGRTFAIDIETDSTIVQDDQTERQQKLELVGVILDKLNALIPAVQAGTLPVEFVQEILSFSVSQYKNSKQLEDAIQSLGPHLQGLMQFEQQMQGLQSELDQAVQQGEQLSMELQNVQGQAQGMEQQLMQIDQREEARKDREEQRKDLELQHKVRTESLDTHSEAQLEKAKVEEIYHNINFPFEGIK